MRAFYHPDQSLHCPRQYLRLGRIVDPKDLPQRTTELLGALDRLGISVEIPINVAGEAITNVHDAGYVGFLQTAWNRWLELPPERGPEVWPSTFPYWSGTREQTTRPACRPSGLLGQLGWYLGDLSVPMSEHTWPSVVRSAETAIAAADAVLAGGNGYALCRPSGHHARTDRGSGFCYLNNTAVAAQHLRSKYSKVAILDLDAHHGDGTQQIFYQRNDILTISVHADPDNYYPFFTGYSDEIGFGDGEGYNLNLPLRHGARQDEALAVIEVAHRKAHDFGAEVLVVALGFDAHKDDPIGVLALETDDFAFLGKACRDFELPTLIVQEGGYAIHAIGESLAAFFRGFAR